VPVARRLATHTFQETTDWYRRDRHPTAVDRDHTLRLPTRLAMQSFLFWLIAASLYSAANLLLFRRDVAHNLRVVAAMLLGGLMTCSLLFLLVERALRPLVVLALAGEP